MSHAIHQAAFAIASDGTLLLNVAHVGRHMSAAQQLRWALAESGELFIGVKMTRTETMKILHWSADIHNEAVAYVVGGRERRMRKKNAGRSKASR